jgi:hypothetical protein
MKLLNLVRWKSTEGYQLKVCDEERESAPAVVNERQMKVGHCLAGSNVESAESPTIIRPSLLKRYFGEKELFFPPKESSIELIIGSSEVFAIVGTRIHWGVKEGYLRRPPL